MLISLAQLRSTPDLANNLARATSLTEQAATRGARWLLFPECTPYIGPSPRDAGAVQPLDGQIVSHFAQLALQHNMFITLGSFHELSDDPDRCYNTQVLCSPSGQVLATYRKLHLFDVTFADGSGLRESDMFLSGDELVSHDMPSKDHTWKVGCSICYDLRFPTLYQHLVNQGAEVITVPSAFTLQTGREHWHALLRARAIETQCYVLAPNQWGNHFGARHSYGQSVIYDPWGRMLASAPEKECIITADLDISLLHDVRARMPCRQHVRDDVL